MDKIKLQGEVVDEFFGKTVNIALSPSEIKAQLKPDLAKMKIGDKILVEAEIYQGIIDGKIWIVVNGCHHCIFPKDIIAHFSAEPEKKKAELPEKKKPVKELLKILAEESEKRLKE